MAPETAAGLTDLSLAVVLPESRKGENDILPFSCGSQLLRCLLLLLAGSLLGCLERIDLEFFGLDLNLYMGCEVADSGRPFLHWSGVSAADPANGAVDDSVTPFAILHNGLARAFTENASLFSPESTLGTWEYRLTLHCTTSS